MFTLVRSLGGWFFGGVILPAEIAKLDTNLVKAIDGDGGGTYAPSALLSIGGLAITLNPTTLTLSATAMAVSAPGTWSAAQTANAAWTFNSTITSAGANSWAGAQTYGNAATVVLSPTRSFSRPVTTMMFLVGTSTMDAVRLPIPVSGSFGAQRIDCVPHGATITAITVQVDPANDAGVLPVTPARLSLGRRAASGSGSAITAGIGGYTYDSGATDAEHSIVHTLSPAQAIDLGAYEYFVVLAGEDDVGKQIIEMLGSRITFTLGTVPFA